MAKSSTRYRTSSTGMRKLASRSKSRPAGTVRVVGTGSETGGITPAQAKGIKQVVKTISESKNKINAHLIRAEKAVKILEEAARASINMEKAHTKSLQSELRSIKSLGGSARRSLARARGKGRKRSYK